MGGSASLDPTRDKASAGIVKLYSPILAPFPRRPVPFVLLDSPLSSSVRLRLRQPLAAAGWKRPPSEHRWDSFSLGVELPAFWDVQFNVCWQGNVTLAAACVILRHRTKGPKNGLHPIDPVKGRALPRLDRFFNSDLGCRGADRPVRRP